MMKFKEHGTDKHIMHAYKNSRFIGDLHIYNDNDTVNSSFFKPAERSFTLNPSELQEIADTITKERVCCCEKTD